MTVTIDDSAGFCWGVVQTIDKVEESLKEAQSKNIYVLGEIIHNPKEIQRLKSQGLTTISHEQLSEIDKDNSKVIIRAHGEPPSTYTLAESQGINLVDATCPLVKSLQSSVKKAYELGWQIVIFGKPDHAEVIGVRGVVNDECTVVTSVEQALELVDFSKRTMLFSQTTMDKPTFDAISEAMDSKFKQIHNADEINELFLTKNTVCKFVLKREDNLIAFAKANEMVFFVAGKNSSNGKSLYNICKSANSNTLFIEDISEIDIESLKNINAIGITGATSTPQWYMQEVKSYIENNIR